MHAAGAAAALLAMAMAACSWAKDDACLMPPWRDVKEHCWEVRGVDTSAGVSTAKWAWDWVKTRCVPVGVDCPPTVWKLFDGKIDCLNQCKGTIGEVTKDPDWHDPPVTTSTTRPYTAHSTTTEPYKLCGTVVDLVMLLDGSGSIELEGRTGYFNKYVRAFATGTVKLRAACRGLPLDAFRVAVTVFGDKIGDRITFDQAEKKTGNEDLIALIKSNIHYPDGGATYTDEALKKAMEQLAGRSSPRLGHDVLKAVLLITDGNPSPDSRVQDTKDKARELRAKGITIISVGVGAVNKAILNAVSNTPKLVFKATDMAEMNESLAKIMDKVQQCYQCVEENADVKECSHHICVSRYLSL